MELTADFIAKTLATGFYLSYIPSWIAGVLGFHSSRRWTGAGFMGTLEAYVLSLVFPGGLWRRLIILSLSLPIAVWAGGRAERVLGVKDDPRIVIDEIAGFWMIIVLFDCLDPSNRFSKLMGPVAFIFFRIFDTVKIWPTKRLERLPGGWGIVADDLAAGLYAAVSSLIFFNAVAILIIKMFPMGQ